LLVLSRPFAGHELLTSRERTVLAQIVRGASSKEAADSDEVARSFRDDAAHGFRHDVAQGVCLAGC
jgi:FixJ family two-component response regulator